jgi:hypothetical protein
MKMDPTPSEPPKTSPGAQNKKNGHDAPDTAENESWNAKRDPTPSVPSKMSPGAQNMKTGSDALGIAENMSVSRKHENEKGRPWYRRKRVRARKIRKWDPTPPVQLKTSSSAQNVKTGPDVLGTTENEFGSA